MYAEQYDWDWDRAEREYRASLSLGQNSGAEMGLAFWTSGSASTPKPTITCGARGIWSGNQRCRARALPKIGFPVVGADPLAYLCRVADTSFAVIGAFHVLDRYPAMTAFQLIRESVRVLQPGGVLILESTNPASLLAGDARSLVRLDDLRPMPVLIAELLLEHFGLSVIVRKTRNAVPQEQHLPFAELDLVRQLNSLLYGPRTYALAARRSTGTGEPHDPMGQAGLA